jgi:hypothetical protein
MAGGEEYSAAQALQKAEELRATLGGEVTFTNVKSGQQVTEAEVKRLAEKEGTGADRS